MFLNNPLVSVIIPVYNAERYVKKCVLSILNQTYKKIEIIAVNDGSVDKSLEILTELKEQYNNIIIINQENGGVSSARNRGIENAKGEYISFVDADDYLAVDCIEKMCAIASKYKADIIRCNYFLNNTPKKIFDSNKLYNLTDTDTKEKMIKRYIRTFDFNNVWGQLIKKGCIKKIRFDHDYCMGEDFKFNLEILDTVKSIYTMEDYLYYYIYNISGINFNDSYNKTELKIKDICKLYESIYNKYDKKLICSSFLQEISPYFLKINEFKKNEILNLRASITMSPIFLETKKIIKKNDIIKGKYSLVSLLIIREKYEYIRIIYIFVFKPCRIIKKIINKVSDKRWKK